MLCQVSEVRDARVVMGENCGGKLFDLGKADGLPSKAMPCRGSGFDSRAYREVSHGIGLTRAPSSKARRAGSKVTQLCAASAPEPEP